LIAIIYASLREVVSPDFEASPVFGCCRIMTAVWLVDPRRAKALGLNGPCRCVSEFQGRDKKNTALCAFSFGNYALYADLSNRVMTIIEQEGASGVKVYSIDEGVSWI